MYNISMIVLYMQFLAVPFHLGGTLLNSTTLVFDIYTTDYSISHTILTCPAR